MKGNPTPDGFDDDFAEFRLPPAVVSEHDEFLSGFGGMDDVGEDNFDLQQRDRSPFQSPSLLGNFNRHQNNPTNLGMPLKSPSGPPSLFSITSPTSSRSISTSIPTSIPNASHTPTQSELTLSNSPNGHYSEHPFGEHPSRTLFVRNINSNVEDHELRVLFEVYGPIRSMYTQCKHRGFVMISYFDIRHAKNAMKHLQSKPVRRRKLDIHYSIPKDNLSEKDQNQGTLVVFNLDASITSEELKQIFGTYGEVKEIRETPNKKHHKFVEFYDVRDADQAMKMLNKTEIRSKKIKIEPSRPGGRKMQSFSSQDSVSNGIVSPSGRFSPARLGPNAFEDDPLSKSAPEESYFENDALFPPASSHNINIPLTPQFPTGNPPNGWNKRVTTGRSLRSVSLPPNKQPPPVDQQARGAISPRVTTSDFDKKRSNDGDDRGSFVLNLHAIRMHTDSRTTLMIRNIPNKYTQKMLLQSVDDTHQGLYDFFYLPIDFKNQCNVGYSFINFIEPISIVSFYMKFHNKKWDKFNSEKVCEITYARIQGKDNLISHFQNSSLMCEDKKCRPIIFHSAGPQVGQQAPFPVGAVRVRKDDSSTAREQRRPLKDDYRTTSTRKFFH